MRLEKWGKLPGKNTVLKAPTFDFTVNVVMLINWAETTDSTLSFRVLLLWISLEQLSFAQGCKLVDLDVWKVFSLQPAEIDCYSIGPKYLTNNFHRVRNPNK